MDLRPKKVKELRELFEGIARLADRISFRANSTGILIEGVDSHSYCYEIVSIGPSFFQEYSANNEVALTLDPKKISKILRLVSATDEMTFHAEPDSISVTTTGVWRNVYRVMASGDPWPTYKSLPESAYSIDVRVPMPEFIYEIGNAGAVSNEIAFAVENGKFYLSTVGDGCDFTGAPFAEVPLKCKTYGRLIINVIVGYVKDALALAGGSPEVHIRIGSQVPLTMEFARDDTCAFKFVIATRSSMPDFDGKTIANGPLSKITVTRIPDVLKYIGEHEGGLTLKELVGLELDTKDGANMRFCKSIGFVSSYRRRYKTTHDGIGFVNLCSSNEEEAKSYLHEIALERCEGYKVIADGIARMPMAFADMEAAVNEQLSEKGKAALSESEFAALLGVATWTGVVGRKLALYYNVNSK